MYHPPTLGQPHPMSGIDMSGVGGRQPTLVDTAKAVSKCGVRSCQIRRDQNKFCQKAESERVSAGRERVPFLVTLQNHTT